jgi:hypothetical protein
MVVTRVVTNLVGTLAAMAKVAITEDGETAAGTTSLSQ